MEQKGVQEVLENHKNSGRFFHVDEHQIFALDYGDQSKKEAVLCLHGVPTSSYLYRKVLSSLSKKGHRAVSIDFLGFGLSDKPESFGYSFLDFAHFLAKAVDALKIEKVHLVVHDMGGPIGFAFAAENKDKIASLSILNTWIDVVNFKKPLVMQPFENPVLGEAELKMITHTTWPIMFSSFGVHEKEMIPTEEIKVYVDLLKYKDNGAAFLKTMQNYDSSEEFRTLAYQAVQNVDYPIQAIWGAEDPALTLKRYGKEIQEVAGLNEIELLYSKHLLQEEVWEALSIQINKIVKNEKK